MVSMSRRFSSSGILVLTISSVMAVSGACTLQPDMRKLDRGTGGTGTNGYANGGANGTGGTDGSSSSSTPVKDNDDKENRNAAQ